MSPIVYAGVGFLLLIIVGLFVLGLVNAKREQDKIDRMK